MRSADDFFDEIMETDEQFRKEVELLELKYKIIDELINYRKEKGISQLQFAEKIGVKQQMISRFELGSVDPRLSFISKILLGMEKKTFFRDLDKFTIVNKHAPLPFVNVDKRQKLANASYTYDLSCNNKKSVDVA